MEPQQMSTVRDRGRRPMMDLPNQSVLAERLKALLELRGYKAAGVSRMAGLGSTAVHDIITGKNKNPSANVVQTIAQVLAVDIAYLTGASDNPRSHSTGEVEAMPILGIVEAGAFRTTMRMESVQGVERVELPMITAARNPEYPKAKHFAFEVRCDSMNALRPAPITPGMFVICVDLNDTEHDIESGRVYVIRRSIDGGRTYEHLLKKANVLRDRIELSSESTNSRHEKIILNRDGTSTQGGENVTVEAVGLVYSAQFPLG